MAVNLNMEVTEKETINSQEAKQTLSIYITQMEKKWVGNSTAKLFNRGNPLPQLHSKKVKLAWDISFI
jgi:hypothetical protein